MTLYENLTRSNVRHNKVERINQEGNLINHKIKCISTRLLNGNKEKTKNTYLAD